MAGLGRAEVIWRLVVVVGVLAWANESRAQNTDLCILFAQMAERFEQLDPEDRRGQLGEWLAATAESPEAQRIVMRAANWIDTGGTAAAVWRECPSI